jgi:hypothetical protein
MRFDHDQSIGEDEHRTETQTPKTYQSDNREGANKDRDREGRYTVCTLVFFGPTGGTSPFWCGLVAGGVSGLVASEVTEFVVVHLFERLEKPIGIPLVFIFAFIFRLTLVPKFDPELLNERNFHPNNRFLPFFGFLRGGVYALCVAIPKT